MEIRRRSPAPEIVVDSLRYQICVPEAEPRNILEKIVWHKNAEVDQLRERLPLSRLQQMIALQAPPLDFLGALRQSPHPVSLIAEVKRASPSKGILREDFDPIQIARAYQGAGASCLSVLTDARFFQGSGEILKQIRAEICLPLLCKEFILYPYQILWARSLGADAVLLIAAILTDVDLNYLLRLVHRLGMTALVEVHTLEELDRVLTLPDLKLVGINNRDLTTFSVTLETTQRLLAARGEQIQQRGITVVSESGLFSHADLCQVKGWGVRSVLVGEALVKAPDPGEATRSLLGVSR